MTAISAVISCDDSVKSWLIPPNSWRDGTINPRHFLTLTDLSARELRELIERALAMKRGRWSGRPLEGRTAGLLFAKSSTRTRVSFEVGIGQLGGHSLFLSPRDVQVRRGEPVADTARVLSRYLDLLVIRWHAHEELQEFARWSGVPVINGLTDLTHPCQVLADLVTLAERRSDLDRLTVAWIGDANNMLHSWIEASSLIGLELRIATPPGFEPDPAQVDGANRAGGRIMVTHDPMEAVSGADVVTTDVWVSMGQEDEKEARRAAFRDYTVDAALMKSAKPEAVFLHCLPAHRGEEVTNEVLEGPRSLVWDEAENRLHAQKSLLVTLLG